MSKPVVKLHAAAMNRMQRSMREALPRETGGILLGWRDHGDIVVVDALPVMDTEADVTHYMRSQDIAKSALDTYLASATNPLIGYVGEWHTHPALSPPSPTDRASIAAAAQQADMPVAYIVMAWDKTRNEPHLHCGIVTPTTRKTTLEPTRYDLQEDDPMSDKPKTGSRFDLAAAYRQRQEALAAKLRIPATFTRHGTTIGDATEADWSGMLRSFLPARYGVSPIFAVDSKGTQSEQIDLAVYDRQYSPLFFETPASSPVLVVPVECIYAVFEIKQELTAQYISYAADKVASVRRLHRTSADIYHLGGNSGGKLPENQHILGGIITQRSAWTDLGGRAARKNLLAPTGDHRLDLGLALDLGAFDIHDGTNIEYSPTGTQLIYFALHLFKRLRPLGTALAPDLDAYEQALFK